MAVLPLLAPDMIADVFESEFDISDIYRLYLT